MDSRSLDVICIHVVAEQPFEAVVQIVPLDVKPEQFIESLKYYAIAQPVARLAGELKRECARTGTTLNLADAMIAAVAIENELTLLTDNVKHFPMENLVLYPMPKS